MIDIECLTNTYARAHKNVRAADCGRVNFRFGGPWTGGCRDVRARAPAHTHTLAYVCVCALNSASGDDSVTRQWRRWVKFEFYRQCRGGAILLQWRRQQVTIYSEI